MSAFEKVFVLTHRVGRDGNTVLGVFGDWPALDRARRAHRHLFPGAKLEVLNLNMNSYIFQEHIDEAETSEAAAPGDGVAESDDKAVVVDPASGEQSHRVEQRGGIQPAQSRSADGVGVQQRTQLQRRRGG